MEQRPLNPQRRGKESERPSQPPYFRGRMWPQRGHPAPLVSHLGLETWAPLASFSPFVINYNLFQLSCELFHRPSGALRPEHKHTLNDRMMDQVFLVLSSRPFIVLFMTCHWGCLHSVGLRYLKKAFSRLYASVS